MSVFCCLLLNPGSWVVNFILNLPNCNLQKTAGKSQAGVLKYPNQKNANDSCWGIKPTICNPNVANLTKAIHLYSFNRHTISDDNNKIQSICRF